jgi:hypothetical protein
MRRIHSQNVFIVTNSVKFVCPSTKIVGSIKNKFGMVVPDAAKSFDAREK